MADNDRFVIIRENELIITSSDIYQIKQLDKFIKTRAEYEDIVLDAINKECSNVLNEIKSVNTRELAKAVVDRLFGEGE